MDSVAAAAVTARYARGALVAAVAVVGIWHLTHDLVATAAYWHAYHVPVAVAVAWLAMAVVGAVAATVVLRGGGTGPALPLCGAVVLLVANAVGLLQVPPAELLTSAAWSWGALGWFGIVLLWRRRPWELLTLIGAGALTALGVVVLGRGAVAADLAQAGLVVCGTATLQLMLAFGARLLDGTARRAAAAATAHADAATAQAVAEDVHAGRARRYQALRRTAAPLLAGLADGTYDPADPAVRHRCAVEATRLRRLIAETDDVPDPLLHELRACADLAERRGVTVDLVCVGEVPRLATEVRRALAEAPLKVLAATRTSARVTVAATPDELVVGIVADAEPTTSYPPPERVDGVSVSLHQEGSTTWAESRWQTGSPWP